MAGHLREGAAVFQASQGPVRKDMGVFYNPVSAFNRSITVVLLNSLPANQLRIGLPMEATGVRGIRILKEVKKELVAEFNDISPQAAAAIRANLKLNKLKAGVSNMDASQFLLGSKGFDFIDVDPFGSPVPFLDAAVKRLSRGGVLGVTATDTAPLAGTYPNACLRKYWAVPLRNSFMHETAVRILIRKVQLIGSQYDRCLTPIFSYYKDHYYRLFLRCEKSKSRTDALLKQHGWVLSCSKCLARFHSKDLLQTKCLVCGARCEIAGPLWLGRLWELGLVKEMLKNCDDDTRPFIETVLSEARVSAIGFTTMGELGSRLRLGTIPKRGELIERLKAQGFRASQTHFSPEGIAVSGNPNWKQLIC